MSRPLRLAALALVVVATAYAAWALVAGPRWTVDDAFIVARYARNLVRHGRLAWNLDGPPVEGFTGYALVAWMALAEVARVAPGGAAAALGVASLFAGAALVYACHRPLGASPLAGAVGYALYLAPAEQTTHALSGLETELFMALVVACAWAALRHAASGAGTPGRALPLLAAACALTRPEGALVGGAFLLTALPRDRAAWPAFARRAGALFVLPVALLDGFRLAYFRSALPNTFYAKLSRTGVEGTFLASLGGRAAAYVVPWLAASVAVIVVATGAGAEVALAPRARPAARALAVGGGLAVLGLAAGYSRSGLAMNYAARFPLHLYGLAAIAAVLLVGLAGDAVAALGPGRLALRAVAGALGALAAGVALANGVLAHDAEAAARRRYATTLATQHAPVARLLSERLGPDATVAVYPDAGLVPYLTGLRAIDFGKLNDGFLARRAAGTADVLDYFFGARPDALVMSFRRGLAEPFDASAAALLRDPRFADWALERTFATDGIGLAVYLRRRP